jgi:hypothetical protein
MGVNFCFVDRIRYFHSSSSSIILKGLSKWTPFQTHYFSENLVAPGTSGPVARNSDCWTTEAVLIKTNIKQNMFHLLTDFCVDGHVNTLNDTYRRKQTKKMIFADTGASHRIPLDSKNSVHLVTSYLT